jgi:NAD(P)-dependent dehydrogenase (short-subunit alcohol dehydrogenase family)
MDDNSPERVALITGCGKHLGIGPAIARALGGDGKAVVVADVAPAGAPNLNQQPGDMAAGWGGLPGVVDELTAAGVRCAAVLGDVSREDDARAMVDFAVKTFGRLDILVNNAAAPQAREFNDIEDVPLDAWQHVLDVNLTGTFLMCRAAVGPMRAQGWGRIINISSIAGRTGSARQGAYTASKHGVIGFTRSLSRDVARDGITVNAICPGGTYTSRVFSSARRSSGDIEAELQRRADAIPVGRLGTAEDVANAALYFASESSGYVTGQAQSVDGGVYQG